MGKPGYPPVNIRFNPTAKIGSKMGGEFTYSGFDPQPHPRDRVCDTLKMRGCGSTRTRLKKQLF